MMKRPLLVLLLMLALVTSSGCASKTVQQTLDAPGIEEASSDFFMEDEAFSSDDDIDLDDYDDFDEEEITEDDPFEGWNRFWFHVNDWFLQNLLKPAHKGYAFIVPERIRSGFSTFAWNITFPVRMANSLLQGEFAQAGVEFDRSLVNFMVSLGFADVASQSKPLYPYHPETENFDYTLATWGVTDGPYFMIPFLGPSTIRGAFGEAGDAVMKPQSYLLDLPVNIGATALFTVNSADDVYKPYDQITGSALEPYVALRNGYLNLRRSRMEALNKTSQE